MSPALAHDKLLDHAAAARAGLAVPAVDLEEVLVLPGLALRGAIEGVEARPLTLDGGSQHLPDRSVECVRAIAGDAGRRAERVEAGPEERLVHVDVPEPRKEGLVEEQGLEGAVPAPERSAEPRGGEVGAEGLGPEVRQERGRIRLEAETPNLRTSRKRRQSLPPGPSRRRATRS